MKWSRSAWASAEPSVGSVPAPSSSSRTSVPGPGGLDDPGDRAEVARERRERLGDRLLVADVGEDVAEDRQPRAGRGRDVEPGLVHEREQAERPQRDGLAAGVRAGHDERRVAVAEADVDRDDAAGQAGMAGAEEDDLGPIGGLGPDRVHVGRERRLRRPEVEPGERVERLAELRRRSPRRAPTARRGSARSPPARPTCASRQALPSSTATSGSMNSVCAAAGRVVDDALDPGPGLGLDRHDVAAVAERDDRLLERAAELRADERVEPAPEPVVRDADGRPQPAEARRRGVEQLAGRVEAAGEGRADRRQRVELAGERVEQRPAVVGERRLEAGGRVERVGDLEELRRIEAAAARRALDRRPDVVRAADPDAGPLARAAPGSGRSRRGRGRRGPGPIDGSSASASRRDGGNEVCSASRSRTSGNSSSAIERASIVGVRVGSGARDAAPRPRRSPGRRTATGRSSTASRRRRSRPAGSATTSGRGSPAGGRLEAERRRRVAAGRGPVSDRSIAERGRDEPGPASERRVRRRPEPRRLARLRGSVRALAPRPRTTRAGRRGSRRRPRAARRRGRGSPPAVPSASVTMFRQSYIP